MEMNGETKKAGGTTDKMQGITVAMGALECPVCYEPLGPPILQCSFGHFVCSSCRARLNKCPVCPATTFNRCFGMDRVLESVEVPCCFAKDGCTEMVTYFAKKTHEKACGHGPCFCPVSGCGFTGPPPALADHLTGEHAWPSTAFKYYEQFDLRVRPGPHVLRAPDGMVFLARMVPVEPVGHVVSLVIVRPGAAYARHGCSVVFSCFKGHHQISTLDEVRSSSLSDGLPKHYFCVVPKASGGSAGTVPIASGGSAGTVLSITIDTELADIDDDELEDESYDEDESCDEDEAVYSGDE